MRTLALTVTFAMVATFASAEPQRVPVSFSCSGYNQVANQYLEAATFAEIRPGKKGNDILTIEVDDRVWSIRLDQARSGDQSRSSRISAFARMISFRITAVSATLGGFPRLVRHMYFSFRSGLKRAATSAGI